MFLKKMVRKSRKICIMLMLNQSQVAVMYLIQMEWYKNAKKKKLLVFHIVLIRLS